LDAFKGLPDEARVWLFAAERDFEADQWRAILDRVRGFTTEWQSHGRPVVAAAQVLEDRVLAVAGVITSEDLNAGVSGCGIDAMTREVEAAAHDAGCRWAGNLDVMYHDGESWHVISRGEFRRLVGEGVVTPSTTVLDLTAGTLGHMREAGVARRAGDAWHAAAFWQEAELGTEIGNR
jgi:hypothetical protein